jgi:hypothetical protein
MSGSKVEEASVLSGRRRRRDSEPLGAVSAAKENIGFALSIRESLGGRFNRARLKVQRSLHHKIWLKHIQSRLNFKQIFLRSEADSERKRVGLGFDGLHISAGKVREDIEAKRLIASGKPESAKAA